MEKLIITVAGDSRASYPHNNYCPTQEDIPGVTQQYAIAIAHEPDSHRAVERRITRHEIPVVALDSLDLTVSALRRLPGNSVPVVL